MMLHIQQWRAPLVTTVVLELPRKCRGLARVMDVDVIEVGVLEAAACCMSFKEARRVARVFAQFD